MSLTTKIFIEDYSDKSFVVRGETKEHKDALKTLGGKWNANLKGSGGWIFSKARKEDVERYLESGTLKRTIRVVEPKFIDSDNLSLPQMRVITGNECISGRSLFQPVNSSGEAELLMKIRMHISHLNSKERISFLSKIAKFCEDVNERNYEEEENLEDNCEVDGDCFTQTVKNS